MTDTRLGITFTEAMAGPFALGADDPEAGAGQGKRDGTTLTMHATITILDLDAFVDDGKHGGRITGTVSFPGLGENLPSKSGVFQLFSPSSDPRLKYMVYELGVDVGGIDYYLAGKKEVRDDPGFDMWADTTTLFTRLHKGTDATGPVAGAGVLRLGMMDLTRMMSTMRAVGAESRAQTASAVVKFGRFFLGELWHGYVHDAQPDDDGAAAP